MNDRKEYLKQYRISHKDKYREYNAKYRKTHLTTYDKLKEENEKLNHYKLLYQKVKERNDELEADMKFVLEQTLGAFTQNWCIDWNFTDIREKYSISDNYEWNKGNNETQ